MPKLNKKEMVKWLHVNDKDLYGDLAYRTVKIYQAIYGTRRTESLINALGSLIFKHSWIDDFGQRHYGIPLAKNLMLSHYHMKSAQSKYVSRVSQYSLDTIRTGQLLQEHRHISFYTVLVSGAVDIPSREAVWIDINNHQPVQNLLDELHAKLAHQISSNKRFRNVILLASDSENPWHITNKHRIYSHGHNHGLIGVTDNDKLAVRQLNSVIAKDFKNIFGYSLVAPHRKKKALQPVQRLTYTTGHGKHQRTQNAVISSNGNKHHNQDSLNSADRFVNYMFKDYHLQTKDCNFAQFMKLPMHQRHLIVCTQLRSTYNKRVQHGISQAKVDAVTLNLRTISIKASLITQYRQLSYAINDEEQAKANADNRYWFNDRDRWVSGKKHRTSREQWRSATGRKPYANDEPQILQLTLEPVRQHSDGKALLHAILAMRAVTISPYIICQCNKKDVAKSNVSIHTYVYLITIPTTTNDRMRHSGIPP